MRKLLKIIGWLAAAAVIIAGAGLACLCIAERNVAKEIQPDQQYDAIIVLGAQVKADGEPSVQLQWRMDAAKEAWDLHPVPVVVCGAQGTDEPAPEAVIMKEYLVKAGIPADSILEDPDSFNTRQNLQNAAKLLEAYPDVKSVLIVTSDYHVPRSMALARDLGFQATGLGSPCKPEYWIKNHARELLAWAKYLGMKYLHLPLE